MLELKVISFNIHHGSGMDKKIDLNRVSRLLRETEAQIIGLNEVDFKFGKRSGNQDQAKILARQVKMDNFDGPTIIKQNKSGDNRMFGNALLTSLENINFKNHRLYSVPLFSEGRGLLEVTININETPLSVFVTHLSINPFLQTIQIREILDIVSMKKHAILMGDFNFKPKSRAYNLIKSKLNDTAQGNIGDTYPAHKPRHKLDFIFTSKNITVLHSEIIKNNPVVSDHLPLAATLKL